MASTRVRQGTSAGDDGDDGGVTPPEDIRMSDEDLDLLLSTVATVYHDQGSMEAVLRLLRVPRAMIPVMDNATSTWTQIFSLFDNGIIATPYRRLLQAALRVYTANSVFLDLQERYLRAPRTRPEPEPEPAAESEPSCHVIVRASDESERQQTESLLRDLGLEPRLVWSTAHALSFSVSTDDGNRVRRLLDRTSLGWTLVPPGQNDYLLSRLYVEGPDGRNFAITDAPAQQTLANVAGEVVDQYPAFAGNTRPTVVDHVQPDGQGRRLDPEVTLHDAGVRDGDQLRVGFQATAGAVNPQYREDALYRVRNQIVAYGASRQTMTIRSNSTLLPTEYELEFRERSFGPPPDGRGEPVEIDGPHLVLVQLGPDFPMTPPHVFWLSPIFHPNVYPNYDSEAARTRPGSRGLVCLGVLSEQYRASMDFGELCQTLVDMAGFRNYGLFEATSTLDDFGRPLLRGNYYDEDAARWVSSNQERILDIGGQLWEPPGPDSGRVSTPRYRNVIEADKR